VVCRGEGKAQGLVAELSVRCKWIVASG
jgi:hypothetical protein